MNTDISCLIFYAFLTLILIISGFYCFFTGNKYLLNPQDTDGNICGFDNNYKYIYFPSPQQDSLWVSTCIQVCPSSVNSSIKCITNSVVKQCIQNNNVQNDKSFHIYSTQTFRGSVCLPTSSVVREKVLSASKTNFALQIIWSFTNDWSLYMINALIAFVVAAIFLLIFRIFGGNSFIIFGILVIISLISFGIFFLIPVENVENTWLLKKNQIVAICFSVLSFLIMIIILVWIIFNSSSIVLIIKYINATNQILKLSYQLYLFPLALAGIMILEAFFLVFLIYSFQSLSQPIKQTRVQPFKHNSLTFSAIFLMISALIYFLWSAILIIHIGRIFIGSVIYNWIKSQPNYLQKSFKNVLVYIGSACKGSFLTTIFGLFKIQNISSEDKGCCSLFRNCYEIICCPCNSLCFDTFHDCSYSYMIVTSQQSYCLSTYHLLGLLQNIKRQYVGLSKIRNILDELLPLIVSLVTVMLGSLIINNNQFYRTHTLNKILVFIFEAIVGYVTASLFMNIYTQPVNTYFIMQNIYKETKNKDKIFTKLIDLIYDKGELQNSRFSRV